MSSKQVVMTTGGIRSFNQAGSTASHPIKWLNKKKRDSLHQPTIGEDIELVTQDHTVRTDPHENRKRRTLVITKTGGQTWGFTVQSYGIRHSDSQSVDSLTYVDYVEVNSPAYLAGMMAGDVILSINGTSLEASGHAELVAFIRGCEDVMRVVVLFEDCCRKVELHLKLRKLKKLLAAKMFELNSLEKRERNLIEGGEDCLSLHSTSLLSLFDDSFCLPPDEDVFTDGHAFMPAASYGSLPRNFSLKQAQSDQAASDPKLPPPCAEASSNSPVSTGNSPVSNSNSPVSNSTSSVSRTASGVELRESCTSLISLNPRVDHRYTSLPPDMRGKRSVQRADRRIGNSLFYGEWLSENEAGGPPPLSREAGVYQSCGAGTSKGQGRASTRSVGNSLFYIGSEEGETETQGEVAPPGGQDNNYSKTGDSIDSEIRASETEGVKLRRGSNKHTSPIRPISLPNLQSLTLQGEEARDSGIGLPEFLEEEPSQDSGQSVSDWISSDSCDTRRKASPERPPVGNSGKLGVGRSRKNVVSTGSVGLGGAKASGRKHAELSRSMGNLSHPESTPSTKSPTSPLLKSFVNWAPVKFTRSKIRHSLSRLRNRSSNYNVSNKNKTEVSGEDLESPDHFSSETNAFNDIQVYATLPKRPKILKPNAKAKQSSCTAEQSHSNSGDVKPEPEARTAGDQKDSSSIPESLNNAVEGKKQQNKKSNTAKNLSKSVTNTFGLSLDSSRNESGNLSNNQAPKTLCNNEERKVASQSSVDGLYEEVMTALQSQTSHLGGECDNEQDVAENNNDYKTFVDVCRAFDEVEMYSSTETLTEQSGVLEDPQETEQDCTLVVEPGTKVSGQEWSKVHPDDNRSSDNSKIADSLSNACCLSKDTSFPSTASCVSKNYDTDVNRNSSEACIKSEASCRSFRSSDSITCKSSLKDNHTTLGASDGMSSTSQSAFHPLSHSTGAYHQPTLSKAHQPSTLAQSSAKHSTLSKAHQPSTLTQSSANHHSSSKLQQDLNKDVLSSDKSHYVNTLTSREESKNWRPDSSKSEHFRLTSYERNKTKSKLNASRVEFFSRNMSPNYSEEAGSQASCVAQSEETGLQPSHEEPTTPTTETSPQFGTLSKSGTSSPRRFVIRLRKQSGGGASVDYHHGKTWSDVSKRRFYTYEEIPPMKTQYSLVNPESCETWL